MRPFCQKRRKEERSWTKETEDNIRADEGPTQFAHPHNSEPLEPTLQCGQPALVRNLVQSGNREPRLADFGVHAVSNPVHDCRHCRDDGRSEGGGVALGTLLQLGGLVGEG